MHTTTELRRARIDEPLVIRDGDFGCQLEPGEVFIEEQGGGVLLHTDPQGQDDLARVALAEFHDWLARRKVVFLSWG